MAVPMANDPPFATLNHCAADLEIPSESVSMRVGISTPLRRTQKGCRPGIERQPVRGGTIKQYKPFTRHYDDTDEFVPPRRRHEILSSHRLKAAQRAASTGQTGTSGSPNVLARCSGTLALPARAVRASCRLSTLSRRAAA